MDARVFGLMILAGLVTLAAPIAVGSWVLAAGAVAAILTARSVVRTEESDVTTAIIGGGVVVLIALGHGDGQFAALAICAGLFAGTEIAALARRLAVDHDAPAAPELRTSALTVVVGLAALVVIAAVGSVKASAPVANVALVAVLVLGLVLLANRAWRSTRPK